MNIVINRKYYKIFSGQSFKKLQISKEVGNKMNPKAYLMGALSYYELKS